MTNMIDKLHVVRDGSTMFDSNVRYEIPIYQRSFAWDDTQLIQLVEDINDVPDGETYYIGSLVVSEHGDSLEVVDGQQRLTSLYLLLHCLGISVEESLKFKLRDKSDYTLHHIDELIADDSSALNTDQIDQGIFNGVKVLLQELNKDDLDRERFIKKLSQVVIYRIKVPENTDLNRYFEIMNTRGEQLEQHDILKAHLMGVLDCDDDKAAFAKIWDACSDMTGYVQMHLRSKDNEVRTSLFGYYWKKLPCADWGHYRDVLGDESDAKEGLTINDIIKPDFQVDDADGMNEDDERVRFESVIDFPYFLLHVLKVYLALFDVKHVDGSSALVGELLDDKKLLSNFKNVMEYGVADYGRIADHKDEFSRTFAICLLRSRFLFDSYIVKREFVGDSSEGVWSLKSLNVSGKNSGRKAYYVDTNMAPSCHEKKRQESHKNNIMLQSALRVSYTSPKNMHWITKLLLWLSDNGCENMRTNIASLATQTEEIARTAVRQNFLEQCENGCYDWGVKTPHIVFNYLDYLIWKSDKETYGDFTFEFRNSVEHWYPQNPSEGTFPRWNDGVDSFGNLCIIQRNVNSKFSNMAPEAKKSTFKEMIAKGSLKLRIMSKMTVEEGGVPANYCWKSNIYKAHEESMISMLKEACL